MYSHAIFLWYGVKWSLNTKYLELIKRRTKFQEKNMSCERVLNFHQWKTFSKNCQPMGVWLWFVYKFTEDFCHSRLFSEFIQTQKRYPISLDKLRILTTCHSKLKRLLRTKFMENLLLAKYRISVAGPLISSYMLF